MSQLKPLFTILIDDRRHEAHYAVSGFWQLEDMTRFQSSLMKKGKSLFTSGDGFNVLGDMSGLAVQDRVMAASMRSLIEEAIKLGMKRQAFVITAPLLKMQFARLIEGTPTEIFTNKADALHWLRTPA
jgi:hypothetical protein